MRILETQSAQRAMRYVRAFKWPSLASFALVWVVTSLLTWGLVCLLALLFMYRVLQAGLIPTELMLAVALIPVSLVTLIVQTTVFAAGRSIRPDSPETEKLLVLLGTPLVTWLCLWLLTYLAGGANSFVIRI